MVLAEEQVELVRSPGSRSLQSWDRAEGSRSGAPRVPGEWLGGLGVHLAQGAARSLLGYSSQLCGPWRRWAEGWEDRGRMRQVLYILSLVRASQVREACWRPRPGLLVTVVGFVLGPSLW